MTKDDFESWLAHPVTEAFRAVVKQIADKAKDDWNFVSWNDQTMWKDGQAEHMRAACRARAECAEDILGIRLEDEEQERDSGDGIQGAGEAGRG